jgi:hypothetical protein
MILTTAVEVKSIGVKMEEKNIKTIRYRKAGYFAQKNFFVIINRST